jgi:hypothetical protein
VSSAGFGTDDFILLEFEISFVFVLLDLYAKSFSFRISAALFASAMAVENMDEKVQKELLPVQLSPSKLELELACFEADLETARVFCYEGVLHSFLSSFHSGIRT